MSRLIKLNDVIRKTSLSKSSIYSFISKGTFPKQVSIGLRGSAWQESDIEQWINDRVAESKKLTSVA
ncbi:MAG: transcriptional regulator [Gammaproteobacteria bacterium]|nr:MAG: transcriptional regulator [Gammaproteobacteria bacterium]